MNEADKNNDDLKMSKKRYMTSIIVTLVIGVVGTLFVTHWITGGADNASNEENIVEEAAGTIPESQYSQYISEGTGEMNSLEKMYAILKTSYYEDLDSESLIEGALDGMAAAVDDPYTEYLNETESTSFEEDVSGSFQGIGAEVMKDGEYVRIVSPIANSPAEAAGVQPNDLIVEVDGESVAELTINEAVALIRGPEGTDVELLIQRGDAQFDVVLTRDTIPIETVFYEVDENNPEVGYINIVNFNLPTYEETIIAIQELQGQGIEKIIFDVRGNPGGLLSTAQQIANIFVPNGEPLLMTQSAQEEEPYVYEASDDYGDFKYNGEAILLVDEGSASASEILAGAMRSAGIPIYGTTTFGKGTVQSVVSLGVDDELKYTSGRWLTADGDWINETGLEPDVVIERPDYYDLFVVNPSETYTLGLSSPEVENLKSVLTALGYQVSDNEIYDESVETAVREFQSNNNLEVNGVVTGDTARQLTDALRTKIEENDTQYDAALKAFSE
jgi:carboxyl-terminal processing protease